MGLGDPRPPPPLTANDLLCSLMAHLQRGPMPAMVTDGTRCAATKHLKEPELGWLTRWIDTYDADRIRQPEALIGLYRHSIAWTSAAKDAGLPHDLVAYAELQIAQLDGEVRRLMATHRFPYYSCLDANLDARADHLREEADRWRAALQECIQEGGP